MSYLIRNGLRFRELYERVIWPRYRITIQEDVDLRLACDGNGALGMYIPTDKVALISGSMSERLCDPRRTFTLYHEVCGHGVLQGRLLSIQATGVSASSALVETAETLNPWNRTMLEWQANTMAGMTAAPMWLVNAQIIEQLKPNRPLRYLGPKRYWLGPPGDVRPYEVSSFNHFCRHVASRISHMFDGLSIEALSYRVERSRIVTDCTEADAQITMAA